RWDFKEQQIVHRGPFGAQGMATGVPELEAEPVGNPQYWKDAQEAESFFESLKGFENQVALHNMTRPLPLGTMRGEMVLAEAAAQGATQLKIVNDAGANNLIAYPEWIENVSHWRRVAGGTG